MAPTPTKTVVVIRDLAAVALYTTDPVIELGDVASSGLEVYITVRRYAAIVAERQPASLGVFPAPGSRRRPDPRVREVLRIIAAATGTAADVVVARVPVAARH
ncbi:MAG: hypothetical protein JWR83_2440 [Aeromicrobium sp.]|nr:hypothetical protein [Aeromicrobium sp.]